jgi:hypothetical protein
MGPARYAAPAFDISVLFVLGTVRLELNKQRINIQKIDFITHALVVV